MCVKVKLTTNSPKIIQRWRRFCAPSHSFVRVTRPISPGASVPNLALEEEVSDANLLWSYPSNIGAVGEYAKSDEAQHPMAAIDREMERSAVAFCAGCWLGRPLKEAILPTQKDHCFGARANPEGIPGFPPSWVT